MTSGTDSNLCKCGRPFPDHNIEEAFACGIILSAPDGCDPKLLNLVCGSCGKKQRDHTLNELMSTSENHHTYRNAI